MRQAGDEDGEVGVAGGDERRVGGREGRLEGRGAERGQVELAILLGGRAGRVVGADRVDRAVDERGDEREAVGLLAEGRIRLQARRVIRQRGVGEEQVEGGDLGRDRELLRLGAADDLGGTAGGKVLQVDAGLGEFGEQAVARDHDLFGRAGQAAEAEAEGPGAFMHLAAVGHAAVLAMVEDDEVEHRGVFQRATHDLVVLHARGRVGDRDHAGLLHRAQRGEGLAFMAFGEGTRREHAHGGVAGADLAEELDRADVVRRGQRVGHRDHRRETAGGGRAGARADRLAGRAARFAEAAVQVDEARRDHETRAVDDAGLGLVGGGELVDEPAFEGEDVALGFVALGGGIDHAGAADPEGGVVGGIHRLMAPVQR